MAKIPMKKQLALAVPESMYTCISQIADKERKSKSEVVREILHRHIFTVKRKKKDAA